MPINQIPLLTRSLRIRPGVSSLFASVLGGVQMPICEPQDYEGALQVIGEGIKKIHKDMRGRLAFQNLPALTADRLKYLQMAEFHYSMAMKGYPAMINISPVGKTSPATGLPYFGVLQIKPPSFFGGRDPKASLFSIKVDVPHAYSDDTLVTFEPDLPAEMKDLYMPVATALKKACLDTIGRGNSLFIATEFAGEMPPDLESYLRQVEKKRDFDSLWVIFQAPKWIIGHSVLVDKDPIIVGRKVHSVLGPQYFFLGLFDPTTWEKEFMEVYTFGPDFR